ncbi:methyltransferase [Paenibacillus montaniterrae]|uniref:Methyltransferase n=1 Tax=Paenibacillus montaniterrae TaxID=429341 RepID=A0A920CTV0_9BACL|nr:SAM-dependent methyltransferase [Paenibacillus montaniterrae]GIP16327.1 methyltransferase [Paenibacillus montaniterrae]
MTEYSDSENQLRQELAEAVEQDTLYQAVLSSPKAKGNEVPQKVIVRPIQLKNGLVYQFESYYVNKVLHENVSASQTVEKLVALIAQQYKQTQIKQQNSQLHILSGKKGQLTIKRKQTAAAAQPAARSHNRMKRRVLEEGKPVAFLVELGIMTAEGRVHAKKQDKFKQINRFLEMVEDVLEHLPSDKTLKIIDFGCGKSYLTFALYHYLSIEQQRQLDIIGLDLKEDVIAFCNELARKLEYEHLHFAVGDIAEFDELTEVDMVVTLHACDTATDAALGKAVNWGASVIMSVPCCQHELFPQVKSELLAPILNYGLLKERFSALATDGIRAQLLETIGYQVQMLEFIDPEHTPKNIMIRAVKPQKLTFNQQKWQQYSSFKSMLGVEQTLEKLLADRLPNR